MKSGRVVKNNRDDWNTGEFALPFGKALLVVGDGGGGGRGEEH